MVDLRANISFGESVGPQEISRNRKSWLPNIVFFCVALMFAFGSGATAVRAQGAGILGFAKGAYASTGATGGFDVLMSFDDRFRAGIAAGHQSFGSDPNNLIDQGLAVDFSGLVSSGGTGKFRADGASEVGTTISSTGSGTYDCGQDSATGNNFCIVCQTSKATSGGKDGSTGKRTCIKIINDPFAVQDPNAATACADGAMSVSQADQSQCDALQAQLGASFVDPQVGFSIGFNFADIGKNPSYQVNLCPGRIWQCQVDTASNAIVAPPEGSNVTNTPADIYFYGYGYCYTSTGLVRCP